MEKSAVTLLGPLMRNLDIFSARLGAPDNQDLIVRRFRAGAFEAAIIAVDGMCDAKTINENILKPCMSLPAAAGADVPAEERAAYLMAHAVSVLPTKLKDNIDALIADALGGQCVLLCDGCTKACVMDTRGFEKRTIGRPEAEKVVLGAHESFSESLRTSITLIRRIVQREELTTEFLSVGGRMKTRCALLYLRGTADESIIARVRRRLLACSSDFPLSCGDVEQVIESHPLALIPQCVRTERPDRAASFLAEGQVLILTDGSPEALGAPATIFHQLHTPDDSSMRWQYGTFLRLVRLLGVLIHLFLPGLYLSVLRFHPDLLSAMLLTSVYETSSRVPFPVFLEALLMTLAFDLITEAGLRAPGALGSALGIVSGLILGQSAVSADIVSPLLLIVVAASGLGGFCVPGYALSIGLKIAKLLLMAAGAAGGLFAMALLTLSLACLLCSMTSLGSPLAAPLAPPRPRNPDLLVRLPVPMQRAAAFFSAPAARRAPRIAALFKTRACAAGLCAGVQVFLLGTGVAMPLSLNAAWLAALIAPPAAAAAAALARAQLVRTLERPCRAAGLLCALAQLMCCVFAASSLVSLAGQTFLSQARLIFIVLCVLLFLFLCALSGEAGAARAAYALRLLPALLLAPLLIIALRRDGTHALFPLFGAGAGPLALSAGIMLSGAAPVLLIALPPQSPVPLDIQEVPGAGFFALRAALGAGAGALFLLAVTLGTAHETLALASAPGVRMRLFGVQGTQQGLLFALPTAVQSALILLDAALMLLGACGALRHAYPALSRQAALGLALAPAAAALLATPLLGTQAALLCGVLSALPAACALLLRRKPS